MEDRDMCITRDQAIAILPDADSVHTFYNASFGLIGADWSKEDIIDKINKSDFLKLTGPLARGMNHGLAAFNTGAIQEDILFIETDVDKILALESDIKSTAEKSGCAGTV